MPITVECTACLSRMSAPDAAAGQKIKCPRCQSSITVPGLSLPEFDEDDGPSPVIPTRTSTPARPAAKVVSLDDDEDRPLRRANSPAKSGLPVGLLIGGGVACLVVLLSGLGFCVYWFGLREKPAVASGGENVAPPEAAAPRQNTKVAALTGWAEFRASDGSFKAMFPTVPKEQPTLSPAMRKGGVSGKGYMSLPADESLICVVVILRFPDALSLAERESIIAQCSQGLGGGGGDKGTKVKDVSRKNITWLGQSAKETVIEISDAEASGQFVSRSVVDGSSGYFGMIGSKNGRPKPEFENTFFNSFDVSRSTPADPPADSPGGEPPSLPGETITVPPGNGTITTPPAKTGPPVGWVAFQPEGGGFRVFVPTLPLNAGLKFSHDALFPPKYDSPAPEQKVICSIAVRGMKKATQAEQDRAIEMEIFASAIMGKRISQRTVTMAGVPAAEIVLDTAQSKLAQAMNSEPKGLMVLRIIKTSTRLYVVSIRSTEAGRRPRRELENGFFDSFEFLTPEDAIPGSPEKLPAEPNVTETKPSEPKTLEAKKGGPKTPVPESWKMLSLPVPGFRASFPTAPTMHAGTLINTLRAHESIDPTTRGVFSLSVGSVSARPLPPENATKVFESHLGGYKARHGAKEVSRQDVTWVGEPAIEIVLEVPPERVAIPPKKGVPRPAPAPAPAPGANRRMVVRYAYVDGKMFVASVDSRGGPVPTELEDAFFDSIESTK